MPMRAEFINPFLESAVMVLEQVVQIKPMPGPIGLKVLSGANDFLWIRIQLIGQVSGDIMFGMSEVDALNIVSAMMGGFQVDALDEIGRSAISELSNMISGNASTKLSSQGVHVDITPPALLQGAELDFLDRRQALSVPLILEGIGQLDIQVLLAS
ncbi:CheY-P phosphatase CheX [Paenibacillus sp. P22]|nr:CheY-P phosphatase CheX [Paenibacillus sp. P22]